MWLNWAHIRICQKSCHFSIQLAHLDHLVFLILKQAISPGSFAPLPFFFVGNLSWEDGCMCPVTRAGCSVCPGHRAAAVLLLLLHGGHTWSSANICLTVCIQLSQFVPWSWVLHTLTVHAQLSVLWAIQKYWTNGKVICLSRFHLQMIADNIFGRKWLYLEFRGLEQVSELSNLETRGKSIAAG